jgi:hypothetical protein
MARTWNVYGLSKSGRVLLATVSGSDSRNVASGFAKDYMAANGGRVCIMRVDA